MKSSRRPATAPRLPERYRIRRHIASGGMASVWCAEDVVLGRAVAVKVLADRFAHDQYAVRRFKREARTAARVSGHPNVVTIFDVGDIELDEHEADPGQRPSRKAFMVMEYLSGGTVADAMRVGAVRRQEALRWLGQAASALDHAHKRGIVHRDIKPGNFLLDNDRVLHVADFGIARLQSEDTITSSGELFGTAAYLSPEQALGGEATGASDRYSLAVAAFELLAGRRPFQAPHFAAQARQHVDEEVPPASEIEPALPRAVDDVLIRGMAKHPQDRYETAGAFVAALQQALEEPVTARTVPLPAREPDQPTHATAVGGIPAAAGAAATPQWSPIQRGSISPRRSGRAAAVAALALVIIGVGLLALLGQGNSKPSAQVASQSRPKHKSGHSTRVHHRRKRAATRASSSTTAAAAPASTTASASSTTTASSPPPTTSAEALQAQGHQELAAGSYPQAISSLRQALHAADPSSLTYAYALYDLGRALTLGGDPQAAIPILEQRLRIPNQTPVVQQALDEARRAAGESSAGAAGESSAGTAGGSSAGAAAPTTSSAAPSAPPKKAKHGHAHRGNGSGGAALPPGQGG